MWRDGAHAGVPAQDAVSDLDPAQAADCRRLPRGPCVPWIRPGPWVARSGSDRQPVVDTPDAEHLDVAVADGTIVLTGKVQSDREHDEAVAAAWAIAGVRSVDDRLTVTS